MAPRRHRYGAVAPRRHRYGAEPDQFADLWLPEGEGPAPVVVLIHGGFWRHRYTLDLMENLALAVTARGWAAWNIEHRRIDAGGAGGWPATLTDVVAAIAALDGMAGVDLTRVVTCGHYRRSPPPRRAPGARTRGRRCRRAPRDEPPLRGRRPRGRGRRRDPRGVGGLDHMAVIDPGAPSWPATVEHLARLLG